MKLRDFVEQFGEKCSTRLKIDLKEEEFKWFLLSTLFGARISVKIAMNTYREFEADDLTNPKAIIDCGWDGLVDVLDRGGYVRYDFKTATKLLEVCKNLIQKYGDLNNLHRMAEDSTDLEKRIKELGKGIGNVTANIFLREMRSTWEKADPKPQPLMLLAAKNLGIDDIKKFWEKELKNFDLVEFETALLRIGRSCRRRKCSVCQIKEECKTWK